MKQNNLDEFLWGGNFDIEHDRSVCVIELAKSLDPGAWRDQEHEVHRRRRFEAINKAKILLRDAQSK